MAKWLKRAVGEISKLRQSITGTFGSILPGSWNAPYALNSNKVDYKLTKELYHNTNDDYKLGAGFAKPIINTLAGFMGVPRFSIDDEEAQAILEEHINRCVSRMQRTHQLTLRDADCYAMLANLEVDDILYPEAKTRIEFIIIPPEQVADIEVNPLTRLPIAYTLKSRHRWGNNKEKEYTVTQRITADEIKITVEGDAPEGIISETKLNQWSFIPIVHFKNEPEETELYGTSELEPVEPYLKAYHDVILHAIQGSKMHSTPRLKLNLKDVQGFLRNNFPDALSALQKGQQAKINLQGRELLLFQEGEDAEFIEAKTAIGDAQALLQLLFYCIVDVSEVPEYCFGTHTPSSHASIKEQAPILVRRVARKREQATESWQMFARMLLAMYSLTTGRRFSTHETTITWDAVVERDEKEFAETLKSITEAIKTALEGQFISLDAAAQFLTGYIDTMNDYISDDPEIPGERERIFKTRLTNMRLEDDQFLDEQKQLLDKALGVAK